MAQKSAAQYVDGFVIAIPKKNTAKYKKLAQEACEVWLKFGALDYKECVIEDARPDKTLPLTFAAMIKAKPGETVWFSFITYTSRKHRDAVNKKVMAHFTKKYGKDMAKMPFDMQRFCYGGFKVAVSA